MRVNMDIYQNIIAQEQQPRRQEITQKIWLWKCWPRIMELPGRYSSLTWDEREEHWRLSGKIYRTQNFTQSAEGHKDGLWTTVLSAAVMILQ